MSQKSAELEKTLAGSSSGSATNDRIGSNSSNCTSPGTEAPVDKPPYKVAMNDPDPDHHFIALHGDPYDLHSGRLVYLCRICDRWEDAAHFRSHDRDLNIRYYDQSRRTLANVACHKWVSRPDFEALNDNLIERGIDRLRQRENEAFRKRLREELTRDKAKVRRDSDVLPPLRENRIRGRR